MTPTRNEHRTPDTSPPFALALKPGFSEAAQRWQAYFCGEMIDRPVVCVTAPKGDEPPAPASSYHDRVFGDVDTVLDGMISSAERTFYGGEAMPTAMLPNERGDVSQGVSGGGPSLFSSAGPTQWVGAGAGALP